MWLPGSALSVDLDRSQGPQHDDRASLGMNQSVVQIEAKQFPQKGERGGGGGGGGGREQSSQAVSLADGLGGSASVDTSSSSTDHTQTAPSLLQGLRGWREMRFETVAFKVTTNDCTQQNSRSLTTLQLAVWSSSLTKNVFLSHG